MCMFINTVDHRTWQLGVIITYLNMEFGEKITSCDTYF